MITRTGAWEVVLLLNYRPSHESSLLFWAGMGQSEEWGFLHFKSGYLPFSGMPESCVLNLYKYAWMKSLSSPGKGAVCVLEQRRDSKHRKGRHHTHGVSVQACLRKTWTKAVSSLGERCFELLLSVKGGRHASTVHSGAFVLVSE